MSGEGGSKLDLIMTKCQDLSHRHDMGYDLGKGGTTILLACSLYINVT